MFSYIFKPFRRELPLALATPVLIWQVMFLYFPMMVLLFSSFTDVSKDGKIVFTFDYFLRVINFPYLNAFLSSIKLATIVTVISAFLAYPIAYYISISVQKKYRAVLMFLLLLPSWVNLIVQVYAWFFLLEKGSLLSTMIYKIGLLSYRPHMLNNYFSVVVGTVYSFLPFMIIPIYSVLERMDKRLIEASFDLGANMWQTFKYVIFPISLPGLLSGSLLVFVPVFGEFAIPTLLGGGKIALWGTTIVDKFLIYRDWKTGAAFSVIGIAAVALLILVVLFLLKRFVFRRYF